VWVIAEGAGVAGIEAETDELMRAVLIRAFGGPEVLSVEWVPTPIAAPGTTPIKVTRAGVNYFDTERRARGWKAAKLPEILGTEVAGARVSDGRRVVGLTDGGIGGYAEYAMVADELAVPIPGDVSDTAALGVLIQGQTASHALRTAARLRSGESVVITAAAGGVGSLAIQLAKWHGASRVIGLASTEEKRHNALALGADAVVDSAVEGLTDRVIAANGGSPVDVVLESVAGPTLDALLLTLATGGRLVAYGQASGASNMVSVDTLMDYSIGVVGFHLTPYLADKAATRVVIAGLLQAVADGRLKVVEGPSFPIASASEAHTAVGSGATRGKVTLIADEAGWAGR
jgi:NADPH:quinone reductase